MSAHPAPPRRGPVLRTPALVALAGVFALFYAYAVWAAIGLLFGQATGPLGLNGLGWLVLLLAVVFPVVVFAGAFALGWRRRALPFALILLCGLGLVAAFWINIVSYAVAYGGSLLGG